jgi:hypothetical protein
VPTVPAITRDVRVSSSASRKADRLAHRKGRVFHVTKGGEIVGDRKARRRGLRKRDMDYSTEVEEFEETIAP